MANSLHPCKTMFINSWKTAGALLNPKGITLNWKSPRWQAKAVFSLLSSSSCTCKYPDFKSKAVKYLASPRSDKMSSFKESGKETGLTILMSVLKSKHIISLPSFFLPLPKERTMVIVIFR